MEKLEKSIANLEWNGHGFESESFVDFGTAAINVVEEQTRENYIPITRVIDDPNGIYKTEGKVQPVSVLAGNGFHNMNYKHLTDPKLVYAVGSVLLFPSIDADDRKYLTTPEMSIKFIESSLPLLEQFPEALSALVHKAIQISESKIDEGLPSVRACLMELSPEFPPSTEFLRESYQPLLRKFGEKSLERIKKYH